MAEVLVLPFKENFYYSTHKPVSVKEIIKSLQGWEMIVKQSKYVLAELTECEIDGIELEVEMLKTGSLYEDLVINLVFGSQEKMDQFVAKCHGFIGEGRVRNTIVFAVIAGLVGYGLYQAASIMNPDATPHFEANNNVILNIGAGETNLTPDGLRSVIQSAVSSKKMVAEGAIKVISPARNDGQASLTIGSGTSSVTIPQKTINLSPPSVNFDPSCKTTDYKDVDIQIRALDLDNPSKGWAAVVPGIIDRRVKLVLDPSLDSNLLAGKMAFRGDITVTYNLKPKDGEYKPVEIMLRAFVE